MIRDRIVIALGNFMGGPDEEFPEPLDYSAMIYTFLMLVFLGWCVCKS